jgi:AraC family transcriptional regulator of adaptative response / DNA-3-methyladenine glycosylase II
LRRGRRDVDQGATRLSLRLPFRPPFDAAGLLRFFARRAVPGVEDVTDGSYARTLRLAHGTGVVRLTPEPDHVCCELHLADLRDLSSAVSRVRRLLDLDADPAAVTRVLGADLALAPVVAAVPGIRVPGSVDGEELLLRALLGRDVTTVLGDEVPGEAGVTRLFPTAAQIATAGLPDDITGVATALAEGRLDVHVGRDAAELRAELLGCPGITPWTADYVLMRVLGAPDVLLTGDAALRRGAAALGISDVTERARRWTPWCSYAGMYLWRANV